MNAGELVGGSPLQGFAGEQRTIPEHLLPGNVSPDALNIDYVDGTIRKRAGVGRLSRHHLLGGGLWVQGGGGLATSDGVGLSGTLHTYECVVQPWFPAVAGDYRVWLHVASGTDGTALWLVNDAGTYKYEARVKHSGGTLTVRGASAVSETPRVVTVSFDTGTKTLRLQVGGASIGNTDDDDTLGADTYTQPAGVMRFGGYASSPDTVGSVVSDFRLWGGAVASSLQSTLRALQASEQTAALLAWWRFLQSDPQSDSSGNDHGLAANGYYVGGFIPGADGYDDIDVLVSANFSGAWYLVMAGTRGTIYEGQLRANTVLNVGALMGNFGPVNGRGPFRMQGLAYREWIVFCNGYGENTINAWSSSPGQLSYDAPEMSAGLTVTPAGSGGGLSAGDYTYLFSVYNSVSGVESAVGLELTQQTASANDEFTIDFTSGGFMPNRYFLGADKIRIYRTEANGAVFYHLADVDIDETTYVDDTADVTIAVSAGRLNPYLGYAPPSRFAFEMEDRLWLGNQAGSESRLVFTERFTLGAFYVDNYLDVGAGDGDVLVGGIGAADRAVVFKRRSIWMVVSGGGQTQAVKLASGVGCVQHATIASSHDTIFWMGEGGVYAMSSTLGGGAPVSLTGEGWREFFEGFTDADYENCSAVWDALYGRYILSMKMGAGSASGNMRKVLVYTTPPAPPQAGGRGGAWALWDADISGFVVLSGGGTNKVFCGWRGYLAELGTGVNDGGNPHGTAHPTWGPVSSATPTTLTDDSATWTTVSAVVNGRVAGLQNMTVTVMDAAGNNVQERTIIYNTDDDLTVSEPWDTTPEAGWQYMLGAIAAHWRSPKLGLDAWDREKRIDQIRVLNIVPPSAAAIDFADLDVAYDGGSGTQFVTDALALGLFVPGHVGKTFTIDGDPYTVLTVPHPNYVTVDGNIGTSSGLTGTLDGASNTDVSTLRFLGDDRAEETAENAAGSRLVKVAPAEGYCHEVSVGVIQVSSVETFEIGGIGLAVEQIDGS